MKHQRHFEIDGQTALRETAQISTMIRDLNRTVQVLELEIETQEVRSGVRDLSNFAYPILSKTMVDRRDNLKVTNATLEQRLKQFNPTEPGEIATAA
jgi:hypothetical protein